MDVLINVQGVNKLKLRVAGQWAVVSAAKVKLHVLTAATAV